MLGLGRRRWPLLPNGPDKFHCGEWKVPPLPSLLVEVEHGPPALVGGASRLGRFGRMFEVPSITASALPAAARGRRLPRCLAPVAGLGGPYVGTGPAGLGLPARGLGAVYVQFAAPPAVDELPPSS